MQEAYRPPCSEYSFCCPTWVPPPDLGGVPDQGTPPARVPPWPGYPPQPGYPPGQGTPPPGYPPGWTWQGTPPPPSWTWLGTPPAAPWHSGKCCKALWDMGTPPPPGVNKLTKWNLLPSRRTTYAGGNNCRTLWNVPPRISRWTVYNCKQFVTKVFLVKWGIINNSPRTGTAMVNVAKIRLDMK